MTPGPDARQEGSMNVSTPYVCATCRPTRTNWFDGCRHATLTDPVRIADALMYERQSEWAGWFSIDRFKLRALIIEAIERRDRTIAIQSGKQDAR